MFQKSYSFEHSTKCGEAYSQSSGIAKLMGKFVVDLVEFFSCIVPFGQQIISVVLVPTSLCDYVLKDLCGLFDFVKISSKGPPSISSGKWDPGYV